MRWIKLRRFRVGTCQKSFWNYGGRWRGGWANAGGASMCRCFGCLETFSLEEVAAAVRQALSYPAIAFDAVKHLVLCAIDRRPPKLDLENYPHLPLAEVALTRAADYQVLLEEAR